MPGPGEVELTPCGSAVEAGEGAGRAVARDGLSPRGWGGGTLKAVPPTRLCWALSSDLLPSREDWPGCSRAPLGTSGPKVTGHICPA